MDLPKEYQDTLLFLYKHRKGYIDEKFFAKKKQFFDYELLSSLSKDGYISHSDFKPPQIEKIDDTREAILIDFSLSYKIENDGIALVKIIKKEQRKKKWRFILMNLIFPIAVAIIVLLLERIFF